jgi:hypothetical protein
MIVCERVIGLTVGQSLPFVESALQTLYTFVIFLFSILQLCPKNCQRKQNYDWCYFLGCVCRACGSRRRFLKAKDLNTCNNKLNKAITFLRRKYNVEMEIYFFEVP